MNWAFEYSKCLEWDTNLQYRYDDFQSRSKFIITQRMSLRRNHSNLVCPNFEFYVTGTITVAGSIRVNCYLNSPGPLFCSFVRNRRFLSHGAAGENFSIWHRFCIDFPLENVISATRNLKCSPAAPVNDSICPRQAPKNWPPKWSDKTSFI